MLREYQERALTEIRGHFAKGTKRVLYCLPTGGGKSRTFVQVMKLAAARGNKSLMAVRGKSLVSQGASVIEGQGLECGVIMAGDKRVNPDAMISVASIDTLYARKIVPDVQILILDEAHLCLSPAFKWLISQLPDAYILAVTATPFHPEGFRLMADVIVQPTNVRELIAQGFLVPARYFSPSMPDLSTVKKTKSDYVVKDLAEAMNQSRLFGDVVKSYQTIGEGRPALLFAVNVDHSKRLALAFQAAGIKAMHLDASHSRDEREEAMQLLTEGGYQVLCSVGVLGCGVDLPIVSCIIHCRPTKSYNLWMQMVGRGTRPYPGKKDLIVLDHAANVLTHGFYETPRVVSLDGKPPVVILDLVTCKHCFATFRRAEGACTGELPDGTICGHKPEPKPQKREIKIDESQELTELTGEMLERETMKRWMLKTIIDSRDQGRKKGFPFHQIKSRYGSEVANASWRLIHECYAAE